MESKTLVQINTVCNGSHGRIMSQLQYAAREKGINAYVAFARGEPNASGRCIRIGTQTDVLLHGLFSRLLDGQGFASRRATRDLVRALEALRPDLIHLHNLHGYYLHLETLFNYLKTAGIPVVWTLHDCWAFTGHCSHFVRAQCDRWQHGCYDCPLKREYPASLLLDQSRKNYVRKREIFQGVPNLTLIAPSHWLGDLVGQSMLQDYPLHIIPNGIDLARFIPQECITVRGKWQIPSDAKILLAVASPFDARKGYADLLRLAARLGKTVRLVMIGLTSKQVQSLPPDITGIMRTEDVAELSAWYAAADAFVNTTYEDTYPTVNMEAMASGTPVICYRVGGCAEQIPEDCGMLVPVGDEVALCDAVEYVLSKGKSFYMQRVRAHACAYFDGADSIHSYLACYQALLGE
ncbi:MAG: glycosyltransferase [Clostridia bacterium]